MRAVDPDHAAGREGLGDEGSMWPASPSGDGATRLLASGRERDDSGDQVRDLRDERLDGSFAATSTGTSSTIEETV
ncbi:hypothetical protein ACWZJV_26665 [Nocardioides sp. WG-D5]